MGFRVIWVHRIFIIKCIMKSKIMLQVFGFNFSLCLDKDMKKSPESKACWFYFFDSRKFPRFSIDIIPSWSKWNVDIISSMRQRYQLYTKILIFKTSEIILLSETLVEWISKKNSDTKNIKSQFNPRINVLANFWITWGFPWKSYKTWLYVS